MVKHGRAAGVLPGGRGASALRRTRRGGRPMGHAGLAGGLARVPGF